MKLKLYMYTQRTPKEIRTPANWQLISRSIMTAPSPVIIVQLHSSATLVLLRCHSRKEKCVARLKKGYYFNCFTFLELRTYETA